MDIIARFQVKNYSCQHLSLHSDCGWKCFGCTAHILIWAVVPLILAAAKHIHLGYCSSLHVSSYHWILPSIASQLQRCAYCILHAREWSGKIGHWPSLPTIWPSQLHSSPVKISAKPGNINPDICRIYAWSNVHANCHHCFQ